MSRWRAARRASTTYEVASSSLPSLHTETSLRTTWPPEPTSSVESGYDDRVYVTWRNRPIQGVPPAPSRPLHPETVSVPSSSFV